MINVKTSNQVNFQMCIFSNVYFKDIITQIFASLNWSPPILNSVEFILSLRAIFLKT